MAPKRSVLVTGGSSELGAAVVERFRSRGDHVVVADLPHTALPPGAELERVRFCPVDVPHPPALATAVSRQRLAHPCGSTSVAPASCAKSEPSRAAASTMMRRFLRIQEINTLGSFNLARQAAREMVTTE